MTRTAAPCREPDDTRWRQAPASRRATRRAGARRSGVWPASFRRGRDTTIRPAERRGGGGGFWAGSFTFNVSKPISPRARSPATDVSEQATAGPEQARVMGSVNFYVQSSLVRSVTGVFHGNGGRCGRAGPAAVGKPPLRDGSASISRRARSVGTVGGSWRDPCGKLAGTFRDGSGTIRGPYEDVLAAEARSDHAGDPPAMARSRARGEREGRRLASATARAARRWGVGVVRRVERGAGERRGDVRRGRRGLRAG